MRKLFLLLLTVVLAVPSYAQFETNRQRSRYNHSNTERYYGLRIGLNSSTVNSDMVQMDMSARTGLVLGAVYGMQLANSTPIWLEAGLFYSEKGGKLNNPEDPAIDNITCRLTYLQVPVVMKYSFDLADDLYIQPLLGIYAAVGVGGKTKVFTKDVNDRKSYDSFNDVNRFDFGFRLGCGVEYHMVYAEIGFDFGLANIGKDDFASVRNQNLFITAGVNF